MSFCPTCKEEYQDDLTVCPVCGETLAETFDHSIIITEMEFFTEEEADRFLSFLVYSNIQNAAIVKDSALELYRIQCNEKDVSEVQTLFQAFQLGIEETKENTSYDEEGASITEESYLSDKQSKPYVRKRDQYADASSTGIMLVVIGVLGLGYVALNFVGMLSLLNGIIPYCLNLVLFTGAAIYGIITLAQAKKLKGQIAEEETLHNQMLAWLNEQVTEEFLQKASDPSLPKEANCLHQAEAMKCLLIEAFPSVMENFIESIVEEKMNAE